MKKIIILLFIILVFFTGCSGIFNLNNFVMPDDMEFLALIEELNNPEKIVQYMEDNFESEEHPYITLTPYELFLNKKGDCDDMSNFGIFIANYHGYKTYQIIISFLNKKHKHSIAVYEENKYSFSDCEMYCSARFNNFLEIVEYDCYLRNEIWIKYTVYDYDGNVVEKGFNNQ